MNSAVARAGYLGRFVRQASATFLSALLVFQPALLQAQQVSPDVTAPTVNQPGVGVAPNGVPLVDIVTPNSTGLSHNRYDQFNVGTPGLILNNHNAEVGTSNLGGVTPGNPNLKNSGPATVILNEVTKQNRSALNGAIEVFGGKADVIIANPNGITCDGCGFINTPRATLTTGVPDIGADGRLNGFTVNGGDVTFGEKGGNFVDGKGSVDLFDVVSRSINVDGRVFAKDLRLTAGRNKFNYVTGEARALDATTGAPEYAIDGSALGAMQANRIKIIVTEKGAGVRMRGDMAANAGELSLSSDGKISIGNASGTEGVTLRSQASVAANRVTSKKRVVVQADKGITLQSAAADDDVVLDGGLGLLSVAGDIGSVQKNVQLSSTGGITAGSVTAMAGAASLASTSGNIAIAGAVTSGNDLTISANAGSITAASLVSFNDITLTSGLDIGVNNDVLAAGNLVATGQSIKTGTMIAGLDFAATKADPNGKTILGYSGDLLLAAANTINSTALLSAGDMNVSAASLTAGNLTSHKNLTINGAASPTTASATSASGGRVDVSGQILAGQNVLITGQGIAANAIISGVNFAASGNGTIVLGSTGGATTASDLILRAASGPVKVATLLSAGNLNVQAASLTAQNVTGHGTIGITSDVNVSGQLLGASDIVINGKTISVGKLISGVDFGATNAGGGNIVLTQSGDLTLNASGGSINTVTVLSAGNLDATAETINATNITGHKNISLTGNTTVRGQLLAANNVFITGQAVSAGSIVSGVDFAASSTSLSGAILLGLSGDLVINATPWGNVNSGTLLSAGQLAVTAASFTAQNVTGHQVIAITGDTKIAGQLLGGDNVSIAGAGIKAGGIVSGVDFAATAKSPTGDVVLGRTGNLDLNATSGSIEVANLLSAGNLNGIAAQNITANALAHQALNLSAGNTITLTGQSLSSSDLVLKAGNINVDTLVSGVDFVASAASSDGGLLLKSQTSGTGATGPSGAMVLDAGQGSITANNLVSGGNFAAHAVQNIGYNSLQSFEAASLAADHGSISIDKTTRAAGDISLTAQSFDFSNNRGQNVATAKNLILNAVSASFAGSKLTYGGLSLNLSGSADFTGASVRAVSNNGGMGDINVKATTINTNSSTALLAQNDLTLSLASLVNPGQLAAGRDLTFNIASDLTNAPTGLIYSGNDAKLYAAGNLTNDQGAIMAGHDLAIAAGANGAKNQSINNISGLIRAENDVSILTENLTNKRLTTPTWENVLVSNGDVVKFQINPETWGKPVGLLFNEPNVNSWQTFMADPEAQRLFKGIERPLNTNEWFAKLYGVITLVDGSSYRTRGITAPDKNMPWIWRNNLEPNQAMIVWLKKTQPLNPDGSLRLDPKEPTKSVANHDDNSQFAWTFTWDDNTQLRQTIREDRLTGTQSPEAMIHAGRNLNVDATTLTNSYSSIEAGGDASLKGSVLNNEGVALHRTTLTQCEAKGGCEAYDASGNRNAANDLGNGVARLTSDVAIGGAGGTIKAAGNLNISGFTTVNNTAAAGSMAGAATLEASNTPADPTLSLTGLTAGAALFTPNAALNALQQSGGLFAGKTSVNLTPEQIASIKANLASSVAKPDSGGVGGTVPGQVFLYETRVAFLDVSKFYGSGYFINRIGYNPDREIPFLGDAFYESQLIDQQLRQLVNQGLGKGSFLPGSDAIEQMKLLLDNGVDYVKAHNLKMGEQLSPEQAAALSSSIVVYQKKTVGGIEVLVPTVYLANSDKANLTVAGALISGGSLDMDVGNVNNSGAIAAKTDLKIAGTNIKANGGSFVAGGNVKLVSSGDLTLSAQSLTIGGTNIVNPNAGVKAGGNAQLAANNDLTLNGVSVNAGGTGVLSGNNVALDVAKVDNKGTELATGTSVTTGGNLIIAANDNVNVIGSRAKAGGALEVTATNGSVNVVTADVAKKDAGQPHNRLSAFDSTAQKQSELSSGGNTSINAGDDILISGSKVSADGSVGLKAGDDINITTAQSRTDRTMDEKSSSTITNTGSEINAGGSIAVAAGGVSTATGTSVGGADKGDLNIIGSKLAANGKVQLKADGDVTIAEAQDSSIVDTKTSSKRIFSSKEATTHTETTTAVGASISGDAGVDIASGENTIISASKVQAGTPDKKADLNVTAGGDLVIASGKDTLERHDASSGKGFLSKQSAKLDSYDERTVGAELGASGSVNLNAGDNAVIAGSKVSAGDSVKVEGDSVSVIGAQQNHELGSQKKKSGLGAGSGDGFVSIWGKEQKDVKQSETLNIQSQLSAGKDVIVTARDTDINILGSHVAAGQDIDLYANRDVNILPGAESASSYEKEKKSGFGLSFSSGGGGASIGIGFGSTTDKITQGSETNAVSSLAAGRDLTITAGRNANLQAAQVAGERNVDIWAVDDVNLLSAQDKSNYQEVHEKLFAGVSLNVSSGLISAAQSINSSAERFADTSGESRAKAVSNVAIASLNAYQALKDIANIAMGKQPIGDVSLTVGFQQSKSSAKGDISTPVPTIIRGGNSVTIEASSGNLTGHGAQIVAGYDEKGNPNGKDGDIALIAGKDVILESAQELSNNSTKNSSSGVQLGLSLTTGSPVGNFNFANGKSNGSTLTQVNSHVDGTGTVFVQSGRDTALKGATVSGSGVTMDIGRNLIIESQLDLAGQKANQFSIGGGFGPTGWSLGGALQKAKGDAALVGEQSGVHAGKGGFDIAVGGKTSIVGGLVTSEATPALNRLETGTLEVSDLDTHSNWKATTYGGGLGPNGPTMAPPLKEGENETGKALSAISPGQIVITDPANQQQNLDDIRRDATDTNTSLPGLPDLKKILDEQYKTQADYQAAAATLATEIGNISNKFYDDAVANNDEAGKKLWGTDGLGRAALHAAGGALLGGVNDVAGAIKGALGGAIASLSADSIHQLVEAVVGQTKFANTDEGRFLINSVAASLVQGLAAAAGGGDAAAYAGNEFQNNYLKREEILQFNAELEKCRQDSACDDYQVFSKFFDISADRNGQWSACDTEECRKTHYDEFTRAKDVADLFLTPFNYNNDQYYTALFNLQSNEAISKVNEIAMARQQALTDAKDECGTDGACTKRVSDDLFNNWAGQKENKQLLAFVSGIVLSVIPGGGGKGNPGKETPSKTIEVDASRATKGTPEYEALNNPPSNTRVEMNNGTKFTTNEGGYVDEITYQPVDSSGVRDGRQTLVGKEGIAGDVGGHIQACRHGGTCDRLNLFPQNSNFNSGAYKRWENEITRALKNGDTVGSITVQFERSNPYNARPDALRIEYNINGVPETRRFVNRPRGGQ
ncbi:hemagglutinin repeat-containing protein [Phyllobacterium sp. 1468]|uniref:hemagglutinin repeat-containing protein n=1 Tax=Phyllobacterium sp. 1468 TaxID=2817759 RepID=UPI0038621C4D